MMQSIVASFDEGQRQDPCWLESSHSIACACMHKDRVTGIQCLITSVASVYPISTETHTEPVS